MCIRDRAYWRQPLDATCAELTGNGFLIERIVEPRPSDDLRDRHPEVYADLAVTPGFIVFSLVKR